MSFLVRLSPLFIAAAILMTGNGLQATLTAVRAEMEGFQPVIVGLLGTSMYAGLLIGTLTAIGLIQKVGHIRVFAALAAVSAASALAMVLVIDPYFWMAMRFLMGFCFSGLATSLESWLNGAVENKDRGRVLSVYSLVDLAAVTVSQALLPILGPAGFAAFAVSAMAFSLSLVPITLSPRANPMTMEPVKFRFREVWAISPLSFMACFTIGLTTGAFRTASPLYASAVGLDVTGVAIFVSAGIVGGAILQMPLGWMSDRVNRRGVLMFATIGAALAGIYLSLLSGNIFLTNSLGTVIRTQTDPMWYFVGAFLFGAFAMPLYSLAIALANDFAKPSQFAPLSAGLIFTYAAGGTIGPALASAAMQLFGPQAFFAVMSLAHGSLVLHAIFRMRVRPGVPRSERAHYTPILRTSPAVFRLARRRLTGQSGGSG